MSEAAIACPAGGERPLTLGEISLAHSVFGGAIDCTTVRIRRRKWFPLQPRKVAMAPDGHIYFHPRGSSYRDDFAAAPISWQGFFIHEMTHVWQAQARGRWYLPTRRYPFCSYAYRLRPGWPLARYGIEQQAEIVRHAFLLMNGASVAGTADFAHCCAILPFLPFTEAAAGHAA